jgi:hypothetical protein
MALASDVDPSITPAGLIRTNQALMVTCGLGSSCRKTLLDPLRLALLVGEDRPIGSMRFRCSRCGSTKARVIGLVFREDPPGDYEMLGEPPYKRRLDPQA